MLDFLKKILGGGPSIDFAQLLRDGAVIIDVRSQDEFSSGHIPGSRNIPLNELPGKMNLLDKSKTIITCCASGMRSSSAKGILKSNGFQHVHNGGGWTSLRQKI
ncbi:MAG: rhodanese-like domain-containing protein [Sediminibacterium sp.]